VSGFSDFYVPPKFFAELATVGGQWYRAIPTRTDMNGIPQCTGLADLKNIAALSPPTLLEEYEIYSYAIGWGLTLDNSVGGSPGPGPTQVTVELALLVNDRVVQVDQQQVPTTPYEADGSIATGAWTTDLVNPVRLKARDRLSVQAGWQANGPASSLSYMLVGAQIGPNLAYQGYESVIRYNVIDLPGSRRL
jgi:hypothetical protein